MKTAQFAETIEFKSSEGKSRGSGNGLFSVLKKTTETKLRLLAKIDFNKSASMHSRHCRKFSAQLMSAASIK